MTWKALCTLDSAANATGTSLDWRGLLSSNERVSAISFALNCQLHRHFVRQRLRQLEQDCRFPPLEFKLYFAERGGFPPCFNFSFVDAELNFAFAGLDLKNLTIYARFEDRLEGTTQFSCSAKAQAPYHALQRDQVAPYGYFVPTRRAQTGPHFLCFPALRSACRRRPILPTAQNKPFRASSACRVPK